MIWQIRDVEPETKARIKARAALHNQRIGEELAAMERAITHMEESYKPPVLIQSAKDIAKRPLEVNPKAHNYQE